MLVRNFSSALPIGFQRAHVTSIPGLREWVSLEELWVKGVPFPSGTHSPCLPAVSLTMSWSTSLLNMSALHAAAQSSPAPLRKQALYGKVDFSFSFALFVYGTWRRGPTPSNHLEYGDEAHCEEGREKHASLGTEAVQETALLFFSLLSHKR